MCINVLPVSLCIWCPWESEKGTEPWNGTERILQSSQMKNSRESGVDGGGRIRLPSPKQSALSSYTCK